MDAGLAGGNVTGVVRVGATVRRDGGEWTPAVHALMAWVRARGMNLIPVPLGRDDQGREVVGYLEGEVPRIPAPPWLWHDDIVAQTGSVVRDWHDATVGFPGRGLPWRLPSREPAEVVCLNDVAPYNMVFDSGRLVGLIDLDMASPGPRTWDLSYLAYRLCPFSEDAGAPAALDPIDRLEALVSAYGPHPTVSTAAVLETMPRRLAALAQWTVDHMARHGRPELADHADMYRRDAERIGRRYGGGAP